MVAPRKELPLSFLTCDCAAEGNSFCIIFRHWATGGEGFPSGLWRYIQHIYVYIYIYSIYIYVYIYIYSIYIYVYIYTAYIYIHIYIYTVYIHIYICIYTLSFQTQTLQFCRVQTKTLDLAVIMLKTVGLSQKTRVFLQTVRIRYSACFQHFSYFASSYISWIFLHSALPSGSHIYIYIWSREKRNPNMEKYGSGIQASSKPCSTRDLPVSTRAFLRNTEGL